MRTSLRAIVGVGALAGLLLLLPAPAARAASSAVQGGLCLGGGAVKGTLDPSGHATTLAGLLGGLSLSWRYDFLLLGAGADGVTSIFKQSEAYYGVHGGFTIANAFGRVAILGELGGHRYSGLGEDLIFTEDDAGSATLLYVGAKATADVASRNGQGGLIGMWAAIRRDLGTTSVLGATRFGENRGYWQVGGTAILVGLRLGFDVNISPGP